MFQLTDIWIIGINNAILNFWYKACDVWVIGSSSCRAVCAPLQKHSLMHQYLSKVLLIWYVTSCSLELRTFVLGTKWKKTLPTWRTWTPSFKCDFQYISSFPMQLNACYWFFLYAVVLLRCRRAMLLSFIYKHSVVFHISLFFFFFFTRDFH